MAVKIAVQNPFAGQLVAETELSRRIVIAAQNLGWEAIEAHHSKEIQVFQPDFVIALHNNSPKLSSCPTYGCMWNPPAFFEGTEKYVKHVLSYDGYLTSSKAIDRWLHHLLYNTPKVFFTAPFYTSCPQNSYQPPQLENLRLAYLGSNWDGLRFQELFEELDRQDYMEVYGNPAGWTHLNHAYKGAIPYDGASVLRTLNQAGVGLCLHRAEHRQAALPSMRIFEIVASGAIAICGDHPFIQETFGDSVLYVDPDANAAAQVEQISSLMQWINAHPEDALERSAKAHHIFLEIYALEKLLLNLWPYHQALIQQKGFVAIQENLPQSQLPSVQIILRCGDRTPSELAHALHQISQQTYPSCSVTLVKSTDEPIELALSPYSLSIHIVEAEPSSYSSSSLWAGLQAIDSDYFMILDASCCIYPNHIQTLIGLLDRSSLSAVYSGGLSSELSQDSDEELINFYPYNLESFLAFEQHFDLSGLLMKRSLLDTTFLKDPQLNQAEDLCLLLHVIQRTQLLFSYELTYAARPLKSEALQQAMQDWSSEISRLKFIFWHQEFAPGKTLQSMQQSRQGQQQLKAKIEQMRSQLTAITKLNRQLQNQLQDSQAKVSAMQTSKFWQLRSAWFKAKRWLRLASTED
ncbi:MAG TPA: glycosyltransferase family A protein [Coleofasciculaceae cyanobacterium]|jgi:hypothetical protein